MANLLTLRNPMDGKVHSVLNGKVFVVHVSHDNSHMMFIEVPGNKILVESTAIEKKETTDDGFTITTASGTVYDLVKVSSLIPTCAVDDELPNEYAEEKGETPKSTLQPVIMEDVHRFINYGDGYDGTVYVFEHSVTYNEFLEFCKAQNLSYVDKLDGYAWYEKHGMIISYGIKNESRINSSMDAKESDVSRTWTYLVVDPYTD